MFKERKWNKISKEYDSILQSSCGKYLLLQEYAPDRYGARTKWELVTLDKIEDDKKDVNVKPIGFK